MFDENKEKEPGCHTDKGVHHAPDGEAEKLSHESFVKNGEEAVMLFVYFETSIADQHE